MILLKKIQLRNFLSHSNTELSFLDNSKISIEGKSGSGKSSIIEGLIWVLYNEARIDSRNLVKHGEKSASVLVELFDDSNNKTYRIERKTTTTAKNSLSILESTDGKKFIASQVLGIKDSQAWVEKNLLHASYELFINSVCLPQDNSNSFVKQNAGKRKDLLLEIANVSSFEDYYKKAKDLLTVKGEELLKNETIINQKESFITTQKSLIVNKEPLEQSIKVIDINIQNNQTLLKNIEKSQEQSKENIDKRRELNLSLVTIDNEINVYGNKIKRVEEEIKEIKDIDIEKLEKNVADLGVYILEHDKLELSIKEEYERQGLLNSIMADKPSDRDYESEINVLNLRLKSLETEGKSCPAGSNCPFLRPIQTQIGFLVEQIQEKQIKRDTLEKDKIIYTEKLKKVGLSKIKEEDRVRLAEIKKIINGISTSKILLINAKVSLSKIPDKEVELRELSSVLEVKKAYRLSIVELLESIEKELKKIDINTTTQICEEVKGSIKKLETEKEGLQILILKSNNAEEIITTQKKEIDKLTKETEFARMEVDQLKLIKDAFGSNGLKSVVIDYLLPRLEERINEVLGKLSDCTVRLDTQKNSADGEGVVEGLYINITNTQGQEMSFDSLSGGERVKVTIAISEALASLQKCSFRILDEAIVSLDKESTESLVETLQKIQDKFPQMICISHLDEVKEIFQDKVDIVKVNGTSQIK